MDAREILKLAKRGEAERVRDLVTASPELLRASDEEGGTALHAAAWKGHAAVVEVLLEAGADPNAQSRNTHYGGTPLHAAAHGNHRQVVALLLQHGAEVHVVSCNGRTPLQETEYHNARAAARLLEQHSAAPG